MDLITPIVLWVAVAAVGFYALFHVIKAAVLGALRQHAAEAAASGTPQSAPHLDHDGI